MAPWIWALLTQQHLRAVNRRVVGYAIDQGATSIYLMDPTFNYPRNRCRKICGILEELNTNLDIEFATEVRAEIIDEALADAFVRAGIKSVEIGLQSSSRETLKLMQRGLGTNHFIKGCRLLHERGIRAEIGMIVGCQVIMKSRFVARLDLFWIGTLEN
jgi:radical SAM superfamily enzyme YgiQ (UPF0313 family)